MMILYMLNLVIRYNNFIRNNILCYAPVNSSVDLSNRMHTGNLFRI